MTDETKDVIPAQPTTVAPTVPANRAQWLALFSEELIDEREFQAHVGQTVAEATEGLTEESAAEVQREIVRLRASGGLARLEAARVAREAVQIAAQIMRDPELHPTPRLAAMDQIHRVAGTSKPQPEKEGSADRIRITINVPGADPTIIDAERVVSTEGDEQ
jgi:hypothetical protein